MRCGFRLFAPFLQQWTYDLLQPGFAEPPEFDGDNAAAAVYYGGERQSAQPVARDFGECDGLGFAPEQRIVDAGFAGKRPHLVFLVNRHANEDQAAIAVFFLMTLTGWFCGQEPSVCAWRGIAGAAAMYAVVRMAGAIIIGVLIDTMARTEAQKMQPRE